MERDNASEAMTLEFLHVTKTGGTSIEEYGIRNGFKWGFNKRSELFKAMKRTAPEKRMYCDDAEWHLPQSSFFENPYRKKVSDLFVVVRNPYTRVISEYRWMVGHYRELLEQTQKQWVKAEIRRDKHFYDFVEEVGGWDSMSKPNIMNLFIQKHLTSGKHMCSHYRPQVSYIFDEAHQLQVEHVLRFEKLHTDFRKLMRIYGIEADLNIVGKRQLAKVEYTFSFADLSPETKSIIYDFYIEDFTLLGYKR